MTEHKPPGLSWESWAERQIEEGRRAGLFDGRDGEGKPIDGLDGVHVLTNETVFGLDTCPARLGIIGGGSIGCELALAFAGFGSMVTVFEAADRLIPNEEPEASDVIERSMRTAGVRVVSGSLVSEVSEADEQISVTVGDVTVMVDALLMAAGRSANTRGLGLEELGVELGPSCALV